VNDRYDDLIIGAGLVGCALARELEPTELRVGVVEQLFDVGEGVSKGNSSILHTGFDAKPGTLEARLVAEGHRLWNDQAKELGVPIDPVGGVMLALDEEELGSLDTYLTNAHRNGVTDVRRLEPAEVFARVPAANAAVLGGLWVPRESVTCTFTATVALAEHAAVNGVEFNLGERVTHITRDNDTYCVTTSAGKYRTRWLINSAGLWADEIAEMQGDNSFAITPRKGEFLVLDKPARRHVPHILLPVPTRISKGILVAPTINGNVLLGPTADDIQDKNDFGVTQQGLARALRGALRLAPALEHEVVVATYAGLRPAASTGEYIIEVDGKRHQVVTAGIRSTGLTASLSIATEVKSRLESIGALPRNKVKFASRPPRSWIPASARPCLDPSRSKQNPAFGRILCLCETVSEAEVTEVLHSPIPATTLDGIKKRTWATAGRCQGFYCTAAILDVMSRELDLPLSALTKRGPGSELIGTWVKSND
jgi:glycerol-3-phosphate dehydrogenase